MSCVADSEFGTEGVLLALLFACVGCESLFSQLNEFILGISAGLACAFLFEGCYPLAWLRHQLVLGQSTTLNTGQINRIKLTIVVIPQERSTALLMTSESTLAFRHDSEVLMLAVFQNWIDDREAVVVDIPEVDVFVAAVFELEGFASSYIISTSTKSRTMSTGLLDC